MFATCVDVPTAVTPLLVSLTPLPYAVDHHYML